MTSVDKLPNFLRWFLVPIVTILALFVANFVMQIIANLQTNYIGFEIDGFFDNLYRNTIAPTLIGYFTIYAGVTFAPTYKNIVSLVLSAILTLLLSIVLYSGLEVGNLWQVLNTLFTILGMGFAVYSSFQITENKSV